MSRHTDDVGGNAVNLNIVGTVLGNPALVDVLGGVTVLVLAFPNQAVLAGVIGILVQLGLIGLAGISTGIEGDVDNHTGTQIGAGVLASAIGALGNIASGNNYSEYGWRNSGDLAAQGATTSLINTASEIFKKQMNIEPEITVNPGTTINIMAVNNIVF